MFSDVICLTETWLKTDSIVDQLNISGYQLHVNSAGEGKGIVLYYKLDTVSPFINLTKSKYQLSKLRSSEIDIIAVYKSQGAEDLELAEDLENIMDHQKVTIICGDFNLCYLEQKNNIIFNKLHSFGFVQLVTEATHIKGGTIDQVYVNLTLKDNVIVIKTRVSFSDHDQLRVIVKDL